MKRNIYFIVKNLYPNAGGLTKSIYDRASFLAEYHHVTIITTEFQLYLQKIHTELIANNKLSNKVEIKNIFLDLQSKNNKIGKKEIFDYEDLLYQIDKLPTQSLENSIRIFAHYGAYSHYIAYDSQKNIHFIDFMDETDPNTLRKRYTFFNGILASLDFFKDGQKTQQVIFNKNQQPILNVWHKNNNVHRVFDMQQNNQVSEKNIDKVINKWLKSFIKENDVFFIDSDFKEVANYLDDTPCFKIGFIHSHQDHCNDTKFLLKFNDFDRFIFLTNRQRNDFRNINTQIYEKSSTIPHPVTQIINRTNRKNRIITISRLVSNKPLEGAIQAFAKVAKQFPDLTYEIYGTGSESEKLAKLIDSLNMSQSIFLKGYTNSALELFSDSLMSIAPTKFEGYGMAILESLSMSCPVITSNVDYGPNEMITDGINGHLVHYDDVDGLEKAILNILNNINHYHEKCLDSISENQYKSWSNKLLNLVDSFNINP